MELESLALKFDTALFTFKCEKQMRGFLETYCFKNGKGRIYLHHGVQYHDFSELCLEHYRRIPSDLKFGKRKRTAFMAGTVTEKDIII